MLLSSCHAGLSWSCLQQWQLPLLTVVGPWTADYCHTDTVHTLTTTHTNNTCYFRPYRPCTHALYIFSLSVPGDLIPMSVQMST